MGDYKDLDAKMKIEYSNRFTSQKMTLEFEFAGDVGLGEMVVLFRNTLLAIGYSEESISDYIHTDL